MKKTILALLIIGLILLAGCESKETKLRKEAQKTELDGLKSQAIEECGQLVNEEDYEDVFCLAKKAIEIEEIYVGFRRETMVDYPNNFVDALCSESSNQNLCYFYEAVLSKNQNSCYKAGEVQEGCLLAVNNNYCNGMTNKDECLVNKAYLLRFIDKEKSEEICKKVSPRFRYPSEDILTCADIDFGETDYDSDSFEDQVFFMYIFSKIAGFEVINTYV